MIPMNHNGHNLIQALFIQKGWPNWSPPTNVATNSPTCTHANCLAILPLQYTILSSSIFSNDRWRDVEAKDPTPLFHVNGYWSGQYLTVWLLKIICWWLKKVPHQSTFWWPTYFLVTSIFFLFLFKETHPLYLFLIIRTTDHSQFLMVIIRHLFHTMDFRISKTQ